MDDHTLMFRSNTCCANAFTVRSVRPSDSKSRQHAASICRINSSTPCGPSVCSSSAGDLLVNRNASHDDDASDVVVCIVIDSLGYQPSTTNTQLQFKYSIPPHP